MIKFKNEKGFTLIELLVVVAIIGILVAIAIPQFASYKKQANSSAAESDLRNMAVAAESYFVTNDTYPLTSVELANATYGWVNTTGVTVSKLAVGGTASLASSWQATAFHSSGISTYTWISDSGGMQ